MTITLKDYLNAQIWAVYKVNAEKRQFFGDTAFGPMWKDFPEEVLIPEGLVLDSYLEVEEYLKQQ